MGSLKDYPVNYLTLSDPFRHFKGDRHSATAWELDLNSKTYSREIK